MHPDGFSKEKYDERSISLRNPEHRVRDIVPQDTLYARLLSWIPVLGIPRPLDIISYLWNFMSVSFWGTSVNIIRRKVPRTLPHELARIRSDEFPLLSSKVNHRDEKVAKILFFMQATETVIGQNEKELSFDIGDMIAVTHFNRSETHAFGFLVDEKYRTVWWQFEDLPYEEAILRPHGRFARSAVCLP